MVSEKHEKLYSGIAWLLIALILFILGISVSYFKSSNLSGVDTEPTPTTSRQPREYIVFYKAGVFGPTNIRIHQGDSVSFQNLSSTPVRVISNGGPKSPELKDFDSVKDIAPDSDFLYTFSRLGIFGYHNLNNTEEGGSVIVRP